MELYTKYKSSYRAAAGDLLLHAALFAGCLYGTKISWAFVVPLGLMQTRTFIVFHDCTHGSYVPSPWLNTAMAHVLGVFVFTPQLWGPRHGLHHKTNGNPENEFDFKFNEIIFYTTNDLRTMSAWHMAVFRISNHPFIIYSVVSAFYFFISQRGIYIFEKIFVEKWCALSWLNVMCTTVAHNLGVALFVQWLLREGLLRMYLLSFLIFCTTAFSFFHTQHTFNPPYIADNATWKQQDSGHLGSSFFQVPYFLKYFTMGIEYHHIHHINSKIPGYHLQKYHESDGQYERVFKLSVRAFYENLWLRVYDPDHREYLTIEEAVKRVKSN